MGNCIESESGQSPSNDNTTSQSNHSSSSKYRNNMIHINSHRKILDHYEILRPLGEGSMGSVSLAKKTEDAVGGSAYVSNEKGWFGRKVKKSFRAPNEVVNEANKKYYALKSIILSRVSSDFIDELRNEINILQSLDHPNIVKAYEVYENSINIYLVLEHCSGGDLYTRGPYSEKESAKIISKLLSAVLHMHNHGVTHRDLKFENIMFENERPDAEVKVIDFGLSKKCDFSGKDGKKQYMTAGVGTMYTMAPQVLQGNYTSKADLWSVGVIAYMLVSSSKPFYQKKRRIIINKILKGAYNFYSPTWNEVSEESKKFVSALLVVDPDERLDAQEALDHKWLSNEYPLSQRVPDKAMMDSIHDSIVNYNEVGNFKKMALMVIAHKASSDQIVQLRKAFDAFDTSNNGEISLVEFETAMKASNTEYSDEEIEDLFKSLDTGDDGKIYYTEFLAATLEAHGRIVEETLAEAFDRIDSDDTGYISKQNLRDFLGKDYTEERVNELLSEGDLNKDGKISFQEFMKAFRDSHKQKRVLISSEESMSSQSELSFDLA